MIIEDQEQASLLYGAINTSGQAAWMIPGGFQFGGASGNTPVGYDLDVLRPFLERIATGPLTYGGLVLPDVGQALGDVDVPRTVQLAMDQRDIARAALLGDNDSTSMDLGGVGGQVGVGLAVAGIAWLLFGRR